MPDSKIKKITITSRITIDPDAWKRVRYLAAQRGVSVAAVLGDLVDAASAKPFEAVVDEIRVYEPPVFLNTTVPSGGAAHRDRTWCNACKTVYATQRWLEQDPPWSCPNLDCRFDPASDPYNAVPWEILFGVFPGLLKYPVEGRVFDLDLPEPYRPLQGPPNLGRQPVVRPVPPRSLRTPERQAAPHDT